MNKHDKENTIPQRARRYAHVGGAVAKAGAQFVGSRVASGGKKNPGAEAAILRTALGGLKGPLMKIAQLIATIPDFLPPDYAAELATLQSQAPPMGWPFVRRRMNSELGPDWQSKFKSFEPTAACAASLGQVHRAVAHDETPLACKLQYPDMQATVEADLQQLKLIFSLFEKFTPSVSTRDAYEEVALRLREELDYAREAKSMALYKEMLAQVEGAHVPTPFPILCTDRLLTMSWLDGVKIGETITSKTQDERNALAITMFRLWYVPFYHYGIIHGDPHLGNYTFREDGGINLLDFGCIRIFRPDLVQGVITLFAALRDNDEAMAAEAYRLWGFTSLTKELLETLNIWARFIYAPILSDSARPLQETNSTQQGRQIAAAMYQKIQTMQGIAIPPEFVLMDRASIGLGSVFLRLGAEVNWRRLFEEMTEGFDVNVLATRQSVLLKKYGLT
ncbi:MAG: ABC1 kinase family protein [Bdellovibrionales bacterium]